MILSDLSIKKPVFAWMLMMALLLFGAIGYTRLGISQNPDVDSPVVNIDLSWEGASPEVMENEVIDPIEEAVMTVEGVKKITSTTRFGSASVSAEFGLDKDIDVAVQEVQTKLARAQRNLPSDIDPPIIQKSNPEDQPILWVGVSGARPFKEMSAYVQDHLINQFQTIPGSGEITMGGFVEPNLRVWLNPEKMLDQQITVDDVITAIESQHSELPGGLFQSVKTEQNVRVLGEAATIEEFGNITIPQRVGQGIVWKTMHLKDIAEIEEGLADVRRISRVNGKQAIGIGLRKQRGANAVEVAHGAKKKIEEIAKELPADMQIGVNFDSTKFIEDNVHELIVTLLLAVFFTGIVCWLFLGSVSSTVNVLFAIPTALGGTLMVIYFLGFTLNTITLMAISMVIGIVVDDAIVVLENIVRHREKGASQIKAALFGAREISFSVMVITSAVIAIFLPVAFMKGMIGKYFYEFGITVSVAVAFSLLEAITLAPMRCSQFLQTGHGSKTGQIVDSGMRKLTRGYTSALTLALKYRWVVIIVAVVLFGLSLGISKKLRREMTPSQDQGIFIARFQTPPGSSLSFTNEVFGRAEEVLASRGEVEKYFGMIGSTSGGESNSGRIFITMKKRQDRPRSSKTHRPVTQQEFMDVLRQLLKEVPGMQRVSIQDRSQTISIGTGRGFPIELSVQGPDWLKLGEFAELIRERLMDTGLVVDVDTSYRVGVPEVKIIPDREKAAAKGVTVAAITRTINSTIGGVRVGKYTKGGRRYDIRISLRDENRKGPADLAKLWVRNMRGEMIPLLEVTRIVEEPTLLSIQRENRERSVTLTGNVASGKSQADALRAALDISKEVLPENYRVVPTGNAQQFQEAFQELWFALFLGIAIAYMILGAQFNSFIHPFTILLALPFSLSGALAALWLTNCSLNMMSMIGILLLMGIVKKNSILLVEFTNAQRFKGLGVKESLLEACPVRLRPILMTSLSIIAGALPSAFVLGPGAELRAPMGVVVIGGTVVSTFLTLFVVPCAYSLLSGLESKRKQMRLTEVMDVLSANPSGNAKDKGN